MKEKHLRGSYLDSNQAIVRVPLNAGHFSTAVLMGNTPLIVKSPQAVVEL